MTLHDELEAFANNGYEASKIVDRWIADIITTLLRDTALTRFELELLLADSHALIERELFQLLIHRVHMDDIDTVVGTEA